MVFSLTVDKQKWTAVSAELFLSDHAQGGHVNRYNHPSVVVRFESERHGYTEKCSAEFRGQRNLSGDGPFSDDGDKAERYMDTTREWGRTYGLSLELGSATASRGVATWGQPFKPAREDRVALALAKRVAKTIAHRNLTHVSRCEMIQLVEACGYLGIEVEQSYCPHGGSIGPLHNVADRGANRKAARAD